MWPALAAAGNDDLAQRLLIRPMIVIVGARLLASDWAAGVNVVMPRQLIHILTAMSEQLTSAEADAVFSTAQRSTTWMDASGS